MTTVEILRAARELVARGWTQGTPARDTSGDCVSPRSPAAVCWCALGAIAASSGTPAWAVPPEVRSALALALPGDWGKCRIAMWNDHPLRTQAEAVAVFDRAAEIEEERAER